MYYQQIFVLYGLNSLKADTLHDVTKKIIIGLEKIGLRIIFVVTDNNSINRKMMSLFNSPPSLNIVYPHPADSSRPLFYIFDSVHVLKSIRNNWLNQKNEELNFFYPDIENLSHCHTASFLTLRKLYNLECKKLLKFGYGLSIKALWPSNLVRQNVRLVLQVFNEYIVEALMELGSKHNLNHFESTANFIKIICTWWKIVNVKTPGKGYRLKDKMQESIKDAINDEKILFLNKVWSWLQKWEEMKLQIGVFTRETLTAFKHSTHALIEISSYCFTELKMSYVLLGKFQTDVLESRFGKYRQLAGSQYNVSLRQIFESEKKLRLSSIMREKLKNIVSEIIINEDLHNSDGGDGDSIEIEWFNDITVSDEDISNLTDEIPIITYLAGYCCYVVRKKLKCNSCIELIVTDVVLEDSARLIQNLNRGGLVYPQKEIVDILCYNFVIVNKLTNDFEKSFMKCTNQRSLVIKITEQNLLAAEIPNWDTCDEGHTSKDILHMILRSSTNTLLNNYVKKKK